MLSQSAIYGIKAVAFIASHGKSQPFPARILSRELDIPLDFLSKILSKLVQAGYLNSIRGTNGGFTLATGAVRITIYMIAAKFMDVAEFKKCFLGRSRCDGRCHLHDQWRPIADRFLDMLKKTTIDKVLK